MYLAELLEMAEGLEDREYDFGLSDVFSWRGVYSEVAFSIGRNIHKNAMLELVNKALTEEFTGWKGGEYTYDKYTDVYFERDRSYYSDGAYLMSFLSKHADSDFAQALLKKMSADYQF